MNHNLIPQLTGSAGGPYLSTAQGGRPSPNWWVSIDEVDLSGKE